MNFISIRFYIFLILYLILYYIIPKRYQWILLLIGNIYFYYVNAGELIIYLIFSTLISYISTKILFKNKNKIILFCSIILILLPLVYLKYINFFIDVIHLNKHLNIILPLGIAFYTLQLIAYIVDVYKDKIKNEKNILKLFLFSSYFPQILQGPIPRYDDLKNQFDKEHTFKIEFLKSGFQLIIFGLFLKLVIADRANIFVSTIFDSFESYPGFYIFIAGILYSFQLYTDFYGCTCLARGISLLFGIELKNNFNRPYFSESIKEFWRKWHISLSSWLRDYVYIPLGGNRKGKIRQKLNLLIVFIVSGFWHGAGYKYLVWGIIHGFYQIIGEISIPIKEKFTNKFKIKTNVLSYHLFKKIITFILVMLAWIIFRASSLKNGIKMIYLMVTTFNPWVVFDDSLYNLGLDIKNFNLLLFSILGLIVFEIMQNKINIKEKFEKQNMAFKYLVYIVVIICIAILGVYGPSYNSSDFIYGGF